MSDRVTLTLRGPLDAPVDVTGLSPDAFASLSEADVARTPVFVGARQVALGDVWVVRGGHASRVDVEGDASQVDGLGAGMVGGELVVHGHAGQRLGAGMRGGSVLVEGNAGDDVGQAMSGGLVRVRGSAGHRVGAALPGASRGMSGGEILISGHAGNDVAARARRGLVVVGGNVGASAGRAMIAGTLVVGGHVGAQPVQGNKRGSLICTGAVDIPVTYVYACTYEPVFVRVLMTHLERRYGWPVDARARDGAYRRFCGDAGQPGKGEILVLAL